MHQSSADSVDSLIGVRLRALRRRLGMTQEQVGEMLGVAFQQIQKYESGKNRIPVGNLFGFSEKIGVPACFFLMGSAFNSAQYHLCENCDLSVECRTLLIDAKKLKRNLGNE